MSRKEVNREERIADLCMVHPLNSWLWLILCLTPTVLYQVSRCLSVGELLIHLKKMLQSDIEIHPALDDIPEGRYLMPDRHSSPPICTPAMRKYLEQDEKTAIWRFKDPGVVCSLDRERKLDEDVLENEVIQI